MLELSEFKLHQQVTQELLEKKIAWDRWDQEIINDIKSGKLDNLINEAIQDFHNGKTEEI